MSRSMIYDAIAHHVWATERLMDTCAALTDDQLTTSVPGTYGPIIATLHHLVSADGWYLSFFFPDRPNLVGDEANTTLAELRLANAANGAAYLSYIEGDPDGEQDIVEVGEGWNFHSPLGFRLAQTVHHGTDHRSQICTGLTSLGIEPPEIDLWAYGQATGRSRIEDLRPT